MKIRSGLVCALFAARLAAAPAFTIDQVLSVPFPSDLNASPKADAVAWVQDAAGVRNVWVAKAPGYKPVRITNFLADDGQEISELAWAPDSEHVFFTRGGSPNSRGYVPNPLDGADGARQEIWEAGVAGMPSRIAEGHSAAVSPDGSMLIWISNDQIWSRSLLSADAKPAQLTHARGTPSHLVWSPEGGRFAFVSDRGDHAFIAEYELYGRFLHYLDPSVDKDQSPVWSPDGKRIIYIRVPADSTSFQFGPKPTGSPWSIRVADATGGAGRELWRASEGRGSVFWPISAANQFFYMADERIVFPWERDGWLHLYSISTFDSEAPTCLTPGNFEVEHASPMPDRKSIVFSSNQDDLDRRHLWRVEPGRSPQRLTTGDGIEWEPAPLSDGRIALIHSDAKAPARAALLVNGVAADLDKSVVPSDFPAAAMVAPQPVVVTARDGLPVHGQLFSPTNPGSGKHPAIVFFHGGSRRQMLLGWHYMQYYSQAYGFNEYLASRGYVVLALNYRSGIGYGLDFREAAHYGATGASEFNDVLGAGDYLRHLAYVDSSRIGIWGGSYGGYLTALALARASDMFAAGVDLHGVHDWNLEVTRSAPARDQEKRQAAEKLAFESSPMASIDTWRSPVLLIQGDDDRTVAFAQTVQLAEALRKQGVPFEQLIFPDEVHEFLLHSHWLAAYQAADTFLARYLKPLN